MKDDVTPIGKSGAARRRRRTRTIPAPVAAEIRQRSRGCCEVALLIGCGPEGHPAQHLHHILMRSQGGTHTATNILHVCEPGHRDIHANPAVSYRLGLLERGVK